MVAATEPAGAARSGSAAPRDRHSKARLDNREDHGSDSGQAETLESETSNASATLALILALIALIGVIALLRKRDDRDEE